MMRYTILLGVVLVWFAATATAEVHILTLSGALPDGRDMEMLLDVRNGSVKRSFALAPEFNKVSYRVDAQGLSRTGDKLAGTAVVTITSDGYTPPSGSTDTAAYRIDAKIAAGQIAGTFSGTYTRTGKSELREGYRTPSAPPKSEPISGAVSGTAGRAAKWGHSVRFALYLDNARAQPAPVSGIRVRTVPRWNLPGFLRFTTSGGKAKVATLRGFGGHPINYFEAEVTETNLVFAQGRLTGTVEAVAGGRDYRFRLAADVIADRVAGEFTKVVDGKPGMSGRVLGTAEDVSDMRPADAIYYLVLDKAVAAHDHKTGVIGTRQMIVHVPCSKGTFNEGVGFAGTYNHTYFDVKPGGLVLTDRKLTGALEVTVNPDPYVPPDGKPIPCTYAIDAALCDGSIVGRFAGKFGAKDVAGRLSGELRPCPSIPEPMQVNIKLDNGAAGKEGGPAWHRRCYVDFTAVDGTADSGSFTNNKGGFKGHFVNAEVICDGSDFTATIEAVVDESRTVQVGRHTFHLHGKAIGLEVVGEVTTFFEGRLWKQDSAFMGTLSAVRQ